MLVYDTSLIFPGDTVNNVVIPVRAHALDAPEIDNDGIDLGSDVSKENVEHEPYAQAVKTVGPTTPARKKSLVTSNTDDDSMPVELSSLATDRPLEKTALEKEAKLLAERNALQFQDKLRAILQLFPKPQQPNLPDFDDYDDDGAWYPPPPVNTFISHDYVDNLEKAAKGAESAAAHNKDVYDAAMYMVGHDMLPYIHDLEAYKEYMEPQYETVMGGKLKVPFDIPEKTDMTKLTDLYTLVLDTKTPGNTVKATTKLTDDAPIIKQLQAQIAENQSSNLSSAQADEDRAAAGSGTGIGRAASEKTDDRRLTDELLNLEVDKTDIPRILEFGADKAEAIVRALERRFDIQGIDAEHRDTYIVRFSVTGSGAKEKSYFTFFRRKFADIERLHHYPVELDA